MKHILVTGAAGYIGGFMAKRLLDDGYTVTILDSLDRGHKNVVDPRALFVKGNLLDKQFLQSVFTSASYDAVIHFAAFLAVAESMEQPALYFENNVLGSLNLLEQLHMHGVNRIIFSSTAGVYGTPTIVPIPEDHPKNPESTYGETKRMVETLLSWYQKIHGINSVALRYFNAAGAALDGSLGEQHPDETHIIPNVIRAAMQGKQFTLFGNDYPTPDGTCVRDYIHVLDLVEAHLLALKKLDEQPGAFVYNVGTGKGYSNKEIVETVGKISGKAVDFVIEPRRLGDPPVLVADNTKITRELGFTPKYSDIETIIKTAWQWHSKQTA